MKTKDNIPIKKMLKYLKSKPKVKLFTPLCLPFDVSTKFVYGSLSSNEILEKDDIIILETSPKHITEVVSRTKCELLQSFPKN